MAVAEKTNASEVETKDPISVKDCHWESLGERFKTLYCVFPTWVKTMQDVYDTPELWKNVQTAGVNGPGGYMSLKTGDEVIGRARDGSWQLHRVLVTGYDATRVNLAKSAAITLSAPVATWEDKDVSIRFDGDVSAYRAFRKDEANTPLPYMGATVEGAKIEYIKSLPQRRAA
jgi:hypothetical protein